jgi:hypothetical protein
MPVRQSSTPSAVTVRQVTATVAIAAVSRPARRVQQAATDATDAMATTASHQSTAYLSQDAASHRVREGAGPGPREDVCPICQGYIEEGTETVTLHCVPYHLLSGVYRLVGDQRPDGRLAKFPIDMLIIGGNDGAMGDDEDEVEAYVSRSICECQ